MAFSRGPMRAFLLFSQRAYYAVAVTKCPEAIRCDSANSLQSHSRDFLQGHSLHGSYNIFATTNCQGSMNSVNKGKKTNKKHPLKISDIAVVLKRTPVMAIMFPFLFLFAPFPLKLIS